MARKTSGNAPHRVSNARTVLERTWLEIASGFERLADQPGKTPWHVEPVERKK